MRLWNGTKLQTVIMAVTSVGFTLFSSVYEVQGDGFRNPPESASAMGRIGSKIVFTEDASSATINPANMTLLEQPRVMTSVTAAYGKREFEPANPLLETEKTEDPWALLPSIFAVWPLQPGKMAVGLGLTVPYGRLVKWDSDASFSYNAPYFASLYTLNLNPGIAYRFTPNLSFGAGVSLCQSSLEFKQKVPWAMMTQNPNSASGIANFKGDGVGYTANAGVTWEITKTHVVALTYRSPLSVDYKGDFTVTEFPEEAGALGATPRSDFSTTIDFPAVLAAGYGIKLRKDLRLELNAEWVQASRNKNYLIDIGNNNALLPSQEVPQEWDDNWTFGVGLDWNFRPGLTARAGYIYAESPAPTRTMIPVASEEDQSAISLGLRIDRERHAVDLAYGFGLFDGRYVSDHLDPALNGKYDFTVHTVSMGYEYKF